MAATLRQAGHQVNIFDRYAYQKMNGPGREVVNNAMLAVISDFKPDLIGFGTVSPLIYDTVVCVALVRQSYDGLIIAGGPHASALPALTLEKIPGLDGVIQGEGEEAIVSLANGDNPAEIPGLWWKSDADNQPASSCRSYQIADLDSLPFPAFDLLDMDFYTRPSTYPIAGYYLSSVSLLTARGCLQNCEFCCESLTYGKGLRFHSPEYVIAWLNQVLTDYKINGVYFHDNDFLVNEQRIRQLCEMMLAGGISKKIVWGMQTRADRITPEMLALLKRAGCVYLEMGIETALQDQLDQVGKAISVGTAEQAINWCRRAGITTRAYLMTGFQGETLATMKTTLAWLKQFKPDIFTWNLLALYPGTSLYEKMGRDFFALHDWHEATIVDFYGRDHLSSVPPKERRHWEEKRLFPYRNYRRRLHVLRVNSFCRLASLASDILSEKVKSVI